MKTQSTNEPCSRCDNSLFTFFQGGGVVIKRWYQLGESVFCKANIFVKLTKVDEEEGISSNQILFDVKEERFLEANL